MHHSMKTPGRMDILNHVFFTSALVGTGYPHAPTALPPGKEPRRRLRKGRNGLDDVDKKKSCPCRDSNSDLSAVQQIGSRYSDYVIPWIPCLTVVY
jgi:hypothetical protein